MAGEIASGRISAPGFSDPVLKAAWLNCNWIGEPRPNIDPQREAQAEEKYLKMQATTQNRIARNLNGSDARKNIITNRKMFAETPKINFDVDNSANVFNNNSQANLDIDKLANAIVDLIEMRRT
jgi:hypothetical protein